jgi:hypothetical protein
MAISNHERVGKALEQLKTGLGPFAGREIKAAIAANSLTMDKVRGFVEDPMLANKPIEEWDASASMKPWREVITPHADMASGRYQQAEFAADLWQVYLGEGSDEYRNPTEFFRRTFLTASLTKLLGGAVKGSQLQRRAKRVRCNAELDKPAGLTGGAKT